MKSLFDRIFRRNKTEKVSDSITRDQAIISSISDDIKSGMLMENITLTDIMYENPGLFTAKTKDGTSLFEASLKASYSAPEDEKETAKEIAKFFAAYQPDKDGAMAKINKIDDIRTSRAEISASAPPSLETPEIQRPAFKPFGDLPGKLIPTEQQQIDAEDRAYEAELATALDAAKKGPAGQYYQDLEKRRENMSLDQLVKTDFQEMTAGMKSRPSEGVKPVSLKVQLDRSAYPEAKPMDPTQYSTEKLAEEEKAAAEKSKKENIKIGDISEDDSKKIKNQDPQLKGLVGTSSDKIQVRTVENVERKEHPVNTVRARLNKSLAESDLSPASIRKITSERNLLNYVEKADPKNITDSIRGALESGYDIEFVEPKQREVTNSDGSKKPSLDQQKSFHNRKDRMPKVDDKVADDAYDMRQNLRKTEMNSSIKIEKRQDGNEVVRVKGQTFDDKQRHLTKEEAQKIMKTFHKENPELSVSIREHLNNKGNVKGYSVRTLTPEEAKKWTDKQNQHRSNRGKSDNCPPL